MGAYAQHSKYFNSISRNICPREAFLQDLQKEIEQFQEQGHHIIVMIDGNEDMRRGKLYLTFTNLHLREVILQKHGRRAPSTYRRNTKDIPIDGIWASLGLNITSGGYFAMDEVITGTDHRALWIDITHQQFYGTKGYAPIAKPSARRLTNNNPKTRSNFNRKRKTYATQTALLERIIALERSITNTMTEDQIKEYETIDSIRRKHVNSAEKKCRKLRKGNIPYSPVIQQARNKIEGWSLLLKSKKGLKVSSRKLSRTLKKAGILTMAKADNIVCIKDELDLATKQYYTLKKRSKELRETHLESLASALASAGNLVKQNVLKQLRHRESQRATAKKNKIYSR
jgi:hypothetical protein